MEGIFLGISPNRRENLCNIRPLGGPRSCEVLVSVSTLLIIFLVGLEKPSYWKVQIAQEAVMWSSGPPFPSPSSPLFNPFPHSKPEVLK